MVSIQAEYVNEFQAIVGDRTINCAAVGMSHCEAAEVAYSKLTGVTRYEDVRLLEQAGKYRIFGIVLEGGKMDRVAVTFLGSKEANRLQHGGGR